MDINYIKGSEAVLKSLIEEGVDTIFGYPGGTIMPLYDDLFNYKDKINHILVRHEQGAVHAAQGYSRVSGKVGVCIATAGPGATNIVTGIADALMDSTPLVCITAQVSADKLGTNFFQEADTISITVPVTKWSYQITSADEVAMIIAKAFYIARNGRPGPVLISLTKNSQIELTNYRSRGDSIFNIPCLRRVQISQSKINEAIELINSSRKPMIIVGQGVTLSEAGDEVIELAERGNIPIVSTLMGLSAVPNNHPLFAGNVGMHGNLAPNMMTQRSDLIVAIGMRFSDRVTGDTSKYAPMAKIIHIDIDKAEFNKTIKSYLQIQGDAKEVVKLLIPGVKRSFDVEWDSFIKEWWKKERESIIDKLLSDSVSETISMAQAVDSIARIGKGSVVIVTDVGQHQMFCARYSKFYSGRSMITSGGLGTMGFGLPAAIGAKLGAPNREVVAILGDGGFQMTIQELGTIMQSNIDLKVVILNNSFLGMVRQWQELFFERRYSFTEMNNPNFLQISNAYSIVSKRVDLRKELDGAIKEMLDFRGAYLLEIVVRNEENVFPMVPSGSSLNEILY
ncbi:MAG: acetolactate synthase, large subunit, biosynthetic type [Bacteroidetes bacterium GWF2_41_61]|nr:MAG: acetolactate synthase, large subunit, biosynthetic type [Bacteroidetes bacterium GWE2_40_15]OFY27995.1 MAG: acetolactate synthase, large subunit, biosynthetic type [Bacteroidetes bacterium GWF2_41_61]OFY90607.1 MAG: acetolactate synthase, large subunit, biosynthetic type [Bacteroidetes bacterium RIFOXYA12_FULL_40_10]